MRKIVSKTRHILFILDHFYPYIGGGEVLFWELTRKLVKEDNRVTVITSHIDLKTPSQECIDGVEIIRVGTTRVGFIRQSFRKGLSLIRQGSITHLHTASCVSMWPTWLLGAIRSIHTTITIHEIYGLLRLKLFPWYRGIRRLCIETLSLLLCRFDEYQCVSRYTFNSLRLMTLIPDSRLSIVRNIVDRPFWSIDKVDHDHIAHLKTSFDLHDKKVGLFFGRLGYIKGLDVILKSLPEIIKYNPHFRLIIISPHNKKIDRLLISYIHPFVVRIEQVTQEELRDRIGLSDMCILPSKAEGFGYAIAEAASMGASIITTQVGAIPEVLEGYERVRYVDSCGEISNEIMAIIPADSRSPT